MNASDPAGAVNLEKVNHVVVVMLENRSFDHMLGYLSLSGGRPEIDGLRQGLANDYRGTPTPYTTWTRLSWGWTLIIRRRDQHSVASGERVRRRP